MTKNFNLNWYPIGIYKRKKELKMKKEIVEEMKDFTRVNRRETFYIRHEDGTEAFITLEGLNYLVKGLKDTNIRVLANCFCIWSKGCNEPIVSQW